MGQYGRERKNARWKRVEKSLAEKTKKNGDINRIPQNMWESRDEGPASREGPTEGSRILQPSKKKNINCVRGLHPRRKSDANHQTKSAGTCSARDVGGGESPQACWRTGCRAETLIPDPAH